MHDFTFYNPTKIHFGRECLSKLDREVPADARVLILYGGGSVKKLGTLDEVKAALGERVVFEFGGIEPNPAFETLMQAVALARKENITFLMAVGGGSVIDGTKFVAAAIPYAGDEWELVSSFGRQVKAALPFGAVLTLSATGSEMNNTAVITRESTKTKLSMSSSKLFPKFALLDPRRAMTLPDRQVANGVVDAFVHVLEQYLTYPVNAKVQDRFSEGLLLTLIEEGPKALSEPDNYDVRANLMWAATQALNGLLAAGVPQDWSTHMIGHELTALFNLDHAQSLAVVLPGTMHIRRDAKREKLLQYAERIWDINSGTDDERIDQAIAKTVAFFQSLGVKTQLKDYGIKETDIPAITEKLASQGMVKLGEKRDVTLDVTKAILEYCA